MRQGTGIQAPSLIFWVKTTYSHALEPALNPEILVWQNLKTIDVAQHSHFTDGETEIERSWETGPNLHNWWANAGTQLFFAFSLVFPLLSEDTECRYL